MEQLIKLIKESGLSDSRIAMLSKLNPVTIWRIRNNKFDPKLSTATKITEAIEKYIATT